MKKAICFILILSLVISISPATALAAAQDNHYTAFGIKAKLNNKTMKWSGLYPYKLKDASMIPIKTIAAALGYKWSIKGKSIRMTKGNSVITFTAGTNKAVVNGVKKTFPLKTTIKLKQVFGNHEYFKVFFNYKTSWNYKTKILLVNKIPAPKPVDPVPVLSGIKVRLDSNLLVYKGQDVYLLSDGTPMIPLQLIAEQLGYTYTAISIGVIRLTKGSGIITLVAGEKKITVNGTVRNYNAASSLKNKMVCVSKEMIMDIFEISCDYFKDSKIVRIYTKPLADVKLYTVLKDSGMYVSYWPNDPKENEYGDELYPLGRSGCMYISISESSEPQELEIMVFKPYPDIRNMLTDIYKLAYPSSYVEVNRLTMATFLEEIYELHMPIYQNYPGTIRDNIDNRRFAVIRDLYTGIPPTVITIGVKNYTYSPFPISNNPSYKEHSANLQKDVKEYILGY